MNPKTVWTISAPFDQSDCDIINNIASSPGVEFEIIDPSVTGIDSGWCDSATGARLVTKNMQINLTVSDEKYNTLIRLKFGDRAYIKEVLLMSGPCVLGM
jgi:hypothetical protein